MLRQAAEGGPEPYLDGFVHWRLVNLVWWIGGDFVVRVSRQTLSWELHAVGVLKLSARPQHYAQNPDAIEAFKKIFPDLACDIRIRKGWPPVET